MGLSLYIERREKRNYVFNINNELVYIKGGGELSVGR